MKTTIAMIMVCISATVMGQVQTPTAAEWQNLDVGTFLTVDCQSKKLNGPGYGGVYTNLNVVIAIRNAQKTVASYKLDIVFLDQVKDGFRQRDNQSGQITLPSGTSTNIQFHASLKHGKEEDLYSVAWSGYIVRLSAYGRPLKLIASSQTLERLAKDPEKMKLLESGQPVSAK